MATPSKKAVAKVPAKKVPAKKAAAPKTAKKTVVGVDTARRASKTAFVSFTLGATIPTQPFGNIQPHITVEAGSYEDALAFAMPKIEALYTKYGTDIPTVFTKVTETEKEVVPVKVPVQVPAAAPAPAEAPEAAQAAPAAPEAAPAAQGTPTVAPAAPAARSEFAAKAEKMIGLAMTEEAAEKIKAQIEKSVKIPDAEKPALLDLVQDKILKLSAESVF